MARIGHKVSLTRTSISSGLFCRNLSRKWFWLAQICLGAEAVRRNLKPYWCCLIQRRVPVLFRLRCACESSNCTTTKSPDTFLYPGFSNLPWRRPTLAQAIQALPSALQRFTAVFGMGTGGTTAVMSPGKFSIAYRLWVKLLQG